MYVLRQHINQGSPMSPGTQRCGSLTNIRDQALSGDRLPSLGDGGDEILTKPRTHVTVHHSTPGNLPDALSLLGLSPELP